MSTLRRISLFTAILFLSGCGDKVPQSEAAKKIGSIPKQTVDRAAERTKDALQQGAERSAREEEQAGKK